MEWEQHAEGKAWKPGREIVLTKNKREILLGTMLARLLERVGIKKKKGCGCQMRQDWMDKNSRIIVAVFIALMTVAAIVLLFIFFAR